MGYSLNGATTGIWLVTVLALAGCAEFLPTEELQANASLSNPPPVGQAETKSPGDNMLRLAGEVEARGSLATALPLYERAAAMPTADASAHVKLGDVYAKLGRQDEAATAYRAALAKQPDNGLALLGLGGVLVRTGQAEQGMALLARAAPLVNSARAYDRLGVSHIMLGQPREALASFEQAHSLDAGDLDIATNLALAAALSGQDEKVATLARDTLKNVGLQDYHRRNFILALGISGHEDDARSAASPSIGAGDIDALIKQGRGIRRIAGPKARALALAGVRSAAAN